MKVTILKNPVAGLQLSELRARETQRNRFCELIELITTFLIYEGASDLPMREVKVRTPMGEEAACVAPKGKVGLVPILRAGSAWRMRLPGFCRRRRSCFWVMRAMM